MRISVAGTGYVGLSIATLLAQHNDVTAVDIVQERVDMDLGSICGGMTSTPALGTLISTAGTEKVAGAYASTYPIALISVVIVSQVLIIIFR